MVSFSFLLMLAKALKRNQTSFFSNHLSKKTFWHDCKEFIQLSHNDKNHFLTSFFNDREKHLNKKMQISNSYIDDMFHECMTMLSCTNSIITMECWELFHIRWHIMRITCNVRKIKWFESIYQPKRNHLS